MITGTTYGTQWANSEVEVEQRSSVRPAAPP